MRTCRPALANGWRGRDPAELYRGGRLASALNWSAVHGEELDEPKREFIGASRSVGEREVRGQRRQNRRLRALLAGTAVLLALSGGGALRGIAVPNTQALTDLIERRRTTQT